MTDFAIIVRAALDEVDDLPGNEFWTIRDASKLAESIQVHLTAHAIAQADAETDADEAAGWAT